MNGPMSQVPHVPPGPDASSADPEAGPTKPHIRGRTALAAASYTLVAAAQKASGFILLILFTRILTTTEYGQVALLTTVGALLMMLMALGLEPRIIYAYFRAGDDLPAYLRAAQRISTSVPLVVAAVSVTAVWLAPIDLKPAWAMECAGACLLAAGTTYPYAVLRASRHVTPYVTLALVLLAVQVVSRVVLVAVLDWGPTGWAAADLAGGVVALVGGRLAVRSIARPSSTERRFSGWQVVREGLPLLPHYLAQWGLALSDRLILALFVTTAAVGIYSAIYQIAAVASLVLLEINRAFMPMYAQHEPGAPGLPSLVRTHLATTFVLHSAFVLCGFAAITLVLPAAYRTDDEIYPLLALGALAYGLYFLPMNALTLVAGITTKAPAISVTALAVNVALNVVLTSIWGLWGAVIATAAGYACLAAIALGFAARTKAVPWLRVLRHHRLIGTSYVGVLAATMLATWPGTPRICGLLALASLLVVMVAAMLKERPLRLRRSAT